VAGSIKTAANTLERFVREGKLELDGMFATTTRLKGCWRAQQLAAVGVEVDVVVVGLILHQS
jgi:hypothetical protein